MLLSILIPGKNDDFRINTKKVLELNLNQIITNITSLNIEDVELVLCDWGSEIKIIDSINLPKIKNFKCVYVEPYIAKKYSTGTSYSIVHPINTAFRHSSGKYVIFWDSDCYVPTLTFEKLYSFIKTMDKIEDMKFYWGSRYNILYSEYAMLNHKELEIYINNNIINNHDKISINNFIGCSIALLMNRELWENSTGWWEKLVYWGWQDIEFHNRLLQKYQFGGDLEDHGIKFYHLLSEQSDCARSSRLTNPQINSVKFKANSDSWGLKEEKLQIINSI